MTALGQKLETQLRAGSPSAPKAVNAAGHFREFWALSYFVAVINSGREQRQDTGLSETASESVLSAKAPFCTELALACPLG